MLTAQDDSRDQYEWLILNENVLVLTKSPKYIAADFRGATLRRGGNLPAKSKTALSEPPPSDKPEAPADAAIRSALVRAAEARRKIAETELAGTLITLEKMLASNKKVPASIPMSEVSKAQLAVDRAKARLEVADAELDAAKAGVDIFKVEKNSTSEPRSNSN
mgnify:CR=1 FL=1